MHRHLVASQLEYLVLGADLTYIDHRSVGFLHEHFTLDLVYVGCHAEGTTRHYIEGSVDLGENVLVRYERASLRSYMNHFYLHSWLLIINSTSNFGPFAGSEGQD